MPSIPILRPREVIKVLKKIGFTEQRQKGSHLIFIRETDKITIVVPVHPKALGKGLMGAIIKKSGLTVEEFIDLL